MSNIDDFNVGDYVIWDHKHTDGYELLHGEGPFRITRLHDGYVYIQLPGRSVGFFPKRFKPHPFTDAVMRATNDEQ